MSAILGRIEFDGRPVDARLFSSACDAIAHYGPDGRSERVEGDAGFAHLHLAIARGRPAEAQPLSDGPLTLVADAILDDRAGLARELGLASEAAAGLSDSALILRAWRRWGEDCPRHLIGDYAFAIWDRERRRLFLARDHIGTRPLYWARRGTSLIFATDIRGLVAFTDHDWTIDEAIVAAYMTDAHRPLPKCFFEEMYFVGPGHHAVFTAEGETATRWWDPMAIALDRTIGAEEAARRLRELLETAVACRVDTDAPVGSHLSGGIDSTSVTVLAARRLAQEGRALAAAYSWSPAVSEAHPDMGPGDERRRISALAEEEGVPLRFGDADGANFERFLRRQIEIEGNTNLVDELPVLEKAEADGVRVLLSGWGGDEAVSSYGIGYLAWLLRRGRLLRAFRVNRVLSGGLRRPRLFARTLWSQGIVPMLPDRLFRYWSPYEKFFQNRSYMSRALAERQPVGMIWSEPDVRPIPDPRKYVGLMLGRGHLASRMEGWACWGAAKSLQYRYPLLDRRVLEFVLVLKPEIFCGSGVARQLMRSALKSYLPLRARKDDPANERLRNQARAECWVQLAGILRSDARPTRHEWLDEEALLQRVDHVPENIAVPEIVAFAEVCSAVAMWHLDRRWS